MACGGTISGGIRKKNTYDLPQTSHMAYEILRLSNGGCKRQLIIRLDMAAVNKMIKPLLNAGKTFARP